MPVAFAGAMHLFIPVLIALATSPQGSHRGPEEPLPCGTIRAETLGVGDEDPNFDPDDPRFSCGLFATVLDPLYDAPGLDPDAPVYEVQLVFHVIESESGRGRVRDAEIREQVRVLNEDFGALFGTPGTNGVDVGIRFVLASVDPEGRPTTGVTRTVNNAWFRDQDPHAYSKALAWDVSRYVNVYTNEPPGYNGYVPWYPQQWIFRTFVSDRIVVRHTTVGRPGRTLTHEMGHYLGLRHVFEYGCYELSDPYKICQTIGDLICDTPPTTESSGCPTSKRACDGNPAPIRNFMDYTSDTCQGEFTLQQANRMRCTLTTWRPEIGRPLERFSQPAEARVRNAGQNPYRLWASEPWLGEAFQLVVRKDDHDFATLFAARERAERRVAAGVLLLDPRGGDFTVLGRGESRHFAVEKRVPPSPSLVGGRFTAQALLHGGDPAVLTNAVDLRIGVKGVHSR